MNGQQEQPETEESTRSRPSASTHDILLLLCYILRRKSCTTSNINTLPSPSKKSRRVTIALATIVPAVLVLGIVAYEGTLGPAELVPIEVALVTIVAAVLVLGIVAYEGTLGPAEAAPIHVTGAIKGAIEYYTQAPFVVPGAGQSINTHSDFFVYTGGMSGNSTIILQPEVSTADIIHAAFIGPFAGTVGNSAPGSFAMIGTFHVDASGPIWKIHNTFSVSEGLDGLAGICGGGTVSGVSVGPIPPSGLVSFSLTYDATYWFGAHRHSPH
jgi:hypothetical protein